MRLFNAFDRRLSEPQLIRFDAKVVCTLLIGLTLFGLLVGLRIHRSSIDLWNRFVVDQPRARPGHLYGEPLQIRSDEWVAVTPLLLSQVKKGLPVENENIGGGRAALLTFPTRHPFSLFRPADWGFFFLDIERGFSFHWNYYDFGLFISFFLLLLLLTGNQYLPSLIGAVWITGSSYVQWWGGLSVLAPFDMAILTGAYLAFSRRPLVIAAAAVGFAGASMALLMTLYVPWLVVLGQLGLVLAAALLLDPQRREMMRRNGRVRIAAAAGALLLLAACVGVWYAQLHETLSIMANTEYPGKRSSVGSAFGLERIFSGFYDSFYRERNFPPAWGNVCEASSFILLFPVVVLGAADRWTQRRELDRLQAALLAYIALILVWCCVGLPAVVGKLLLLDRSPPARSIVGLGVASILITILFLVRPRETPSAALRFGGPLVWGALLVRHGWKLHDSPFFTSQRIAWVALGGVLAAIALIEQLPWLLAALVAVAVLPNFAIHPVEQGLAAIRSKEIYQFVEKLHRRDPQPRWAVYGDFIYTNFLKTTGATVINGTHIVPDLKRMQVLDPGGDNLKAYNRYGHLLLRPRTDDQVVFDYRKEESGAPMGMPPDLYSLDINPCSPRLQQLQVGYFAFVGQPAGAEFTCLALVGQRSGWWIYHRR